MSSFVVSHNTIDRILNAARRLSFFKIKIGKEVRPSNSVMVSEWTEFGRKMILFNQQATSCRYNGEKFETLPGRIGEKREEYFFKMIQCPSIIDGIKAADCWIYQCSEGNFDKRKMYKEIVRMRDAMMSEYVRGLPEYDKAGWDA